MIMYQKLSNNFTKSYYSQLLEETRQIVIRRHDGTIIWQSLLSQIEDIQIMIKNGNVSLCWEDIYERYSMGTIAINYFTKEDEMQLRLLDVFYGIVHFDDLLND